MKILSLKLSAFGPYKEEVYFDFKKFNSKGLFLITGPTGGGKTTILDGICFALYCRSTGGLRTFAQMRNLNADENRYTEVCFEFSIAKTQYKFLRRLKVHRPRGTQNIKLKDEHACYVLRDGCYEIIDSGSEHKVTLCAEKIIGLDCKQFSKVIVLPQGRFKELLLASSHEKSKIFESLFKVEKWDKLCSLVQDRTIAAKKECDNLFLKQNFLCCSQDVKSKDELLDKIVSLKKENQKAKEDLENTLKEKEKLKDTLDILEKIAEAEKEVNLHENSLLECKKNLDKVKRQFVDAASFDDVTNDVEKIAVLQNKLSLVERRQTLQKKYSDENKNLIAINDKILHLQSKLSDLQKKINQSSSALLAKELKEGLPCPVCGSRDHPNPCNFNDNFFYQQKDKLDVIEKELQSQQKNAVIKQMELSKIDAELKSINENICPEDSKDSILSDLSLTKKHYEQNIKKMQIDLSTTKSKLDIANANLHNAEKLLSASSEKLKKLTSFIDEHDVNDIKSIKVELKSAELKLSSLLTFIGKFEEIYKKSTETLSELNKLDLKIKDKTDEFSKTNRIFQLLSGSNKSKIPIKNFVLGVMMDKILLRANVYLAYASRYRYSLSRSDISHKRGYQGLDIEVFDAELGGVRPVHTLSGGEMFLASLSLAFGLSDVLQEHLGGIRIDSIFIDEGFDSLDLCTLDILMNSFEKIKNPERVIGIISHVSDLKNYIPYKISVPVDEYKNRK